MCALVPVAVSLLIFGSERQNRQAVIVEEGTPIVGANHVTRAALGIETLGGVFTPLIKPGTRVPCSHSEVFSTANDGQSQIMVNLFRGTEQMAVKNHALGRFRILNIPAAHRGIPQIEVTFSITDAKITLSARDLMRNTDLKIERVVGDRQP
jgi:molecular chaperone DnaK (HSP70)